MKHGGLVLDQHPRYGQKYAGDACLCSKVEVRYVYVDVKATITASFAEEETIDLLSLG